MKTFALALLLPLAACGASAFEQAPRTERAQTRLTRALEGKVAGAPQRCISQFRRNGQNIIDRNTILYENGRNLVYRNDPVGGCMGLDSSRILVVQPFIGGELCRGDIIRVVDQVSGSLVGSCAFSDFVPYTTSRGPDPRGS